MFGEKRTKCSKEWKCSEGLICFAHFHFCWSAHVSSGEERRAGLDKGNKLAFFTTENQRPYQPRFPPRDPRLFLQTGGFHPRRPTGFPSSSTRISHRPPELFSPGDQEDCLRKASGFLPPTNGGDDSASCCRLLTAPGLRW